MQTHADFKLDADHVAGVTYDGESLWVSLIKKGDAASTSLARIDRRTGAITSRNTTTKVAGLTWDGKHLWGNTAEGIVCFDPLTLAVVKTLPLPYDWDNLTGLGWDGEALWAGDFAGRRMVKIDPETGNILRELKSDRYVTGICWVGDELWHATMNDDTAATGCAAELRQIDARSGAVLARHEFPFAISGLEHDGKSFWVGDCNLGKLRALADTGL